jgi:hypothetical protein
MKYLSPWKKISETEEVIFSLGSKEPFIYIIHDPDPNDVRGYATAGMIRFSNGRFSYDTRAEARQFVETTLIDNGYCFLDDERYEKLELLI